MTGCGRGKTKPIPALPPEDDAHGPLWVLPAPLPAPGAPLADVVAAASRHRLVWVDLELPR